ncbi:MAG TPA: methyl-accepting chemotaxis protein [Aromatoleum sp.]|uniref:methyl-accepting chemotaxis protein n=1 Tax=Aromatoleum sp. TaxID=2307007 RepID=UPI002B475C1F|nr:methyl-accepting chemotaxis protein [Aromatoleum sp.]HJV28101.1 methyl-accepting chemotaxis protein [Aromatoleum sp.]
MKKLQSLKVSTRLAWLTGVAVIGLLLAVGVFLVQGKAQALKDKQDKTRNVVESAYSVLVHFNQLEKDGVMTREEAQKAAGETIRQMRYDGDEYFWINDTTPRTLYHGAKAELEGKDMSGLKDPNGKQLFVEFVRVVKEQGSGFVDYYWPKAGSQVPVPKISYVRGFTPWDWIIGSGIYIDDLEAEFHQQVIKLAMMIVPILLVLGVLSLMISRSIARQLGGEPIYAAEAVHRIANGDLSMELQVRKGDTTSLLASLKTMQDSLRTTVDEVQILVEAAATRGEFDVTVTTEGRKGFMLTLAEQLNLLSEITDKGLRDVMQVADALAHGDLTQTVDNDYPGLFAQTREGINTTVENLRKLVDEIKSSVDSINIASKEIAQGNQDLSQRTEEQASSLEETASSMEELTSTVKQNAENARHANQLANGASEAAGKGGVVVGEVVGTMRSINDSSRKIVDIISVIDGIAFQTNILALNAAVEAARAGEQGRGFAVVASEVRSLAQRSAGAAKEIKALIDDSVEKVEKGSRLVEQAGTSMDEIVGSIRRVTDVMGEISAASIEQSSGIEQVNQAVTQMDEVTQQNAALVEEAAAAAEALEEQAQNLAQAVSVFKLDGRAAAGMNVAKAATDAVLRRAAAPAAPRAPARPAPLLARSTRKPVPALPAGGPEDEWDEF